MEQRIQMRDSHYLFHKVRKQRAEGERERETARLSVYESNARIRHSQMHYLFTSDILFLNLAQRHLHPVLICFCIFAFYDLHTHKHKYTKQNVILPFLHRTTAVFM